MATSAEKSWRPTEEQRRAVEAVDRSMAVEAAAGSGKTSVLIGRIMRIVGGDWSRLSRVLAITFTEKAAGELKARLRPLVPARDRHLLEGAWIGTFHGFCARILRRHAPRIGLDPAFSIMEENSAMLERAAAAKGTLVDLVNAGDEEAMLLVEAVEFKTAVGALESLMEFRQHAKPALANDACAVGWEKEALRALSSVFVRALERYRNLLAGLSSLDFEELEARALELMSLPDVRESLSAKFDHILVDEFQDTSDAQTELVLALFDPTRVKLFIVGDEAQSIYRFRGANVGCFARVRKAIEKAGGESVRLSANFRSAPGIISFVNGSRGALSDGLFADPAVERLMEAGRLYGRGERAAFSPAVRVIELASEGNAAQRRDEEARAIARHTARLIRDDGVYPGDVVCLFRALTSVTAYEAALRREGVPAIVSGGRGLLGRREVADLMAALTFAADPRDERALLTLLRSPMFSLSDDEILLLSSGGGKLRESAVAHPSCGALAELLRLAPHLRPSEFLRSAVDLTGYEAAVSRIDPSGGMAANVDRFITMAQSIESELPIPLADFAAFVGDLRARSARLGDPPAAGDTARAVRLMSVHAAKGLEFPVVFLPDLFHGGSSHRDPWIFSRGGATGARPGFAFKQRDPERPFDKPEATERFKKLLAEEKAEGELEMKRLLYVAMTRARDLLVLPLHSDASRAGPWHGWVESAVAAAAGKGGAGSQLLILSGEDVSCGGRDAKEAIPLFALPRGYRKSTRRAFTVTELEAYDTCPLRYSHSFVTRLPSRDFAAAADDWIEKELFGLVVHAALARGPAETEDGLRSLIRAACVENGVVPADDFIRRIERQVKSAEKLSGSGVGSAGFKELSFEWNVGGAVVTGSIDWLRPAGGSLEVVDFKTGKIEARRVDERALSYDLQLTAYALAAEEMTGKAVSSTKVVFTDPARIVESKMTDGRRGAALSRIERAIGGIRGEEFGRPPAPPCETCPYHHNGMCWGDRLKKRKSATGCS